VGHAGAHLPHRPAARARSSTFFNDMLRFRTDSSTWEVLAEKLPFEPRAHHTAVLVRPGAAGGRQRGSTGCCC
jgi:hypothetical protein